jgi:hypothetical protein
MRIVKIGTAPAHAFCRRAMTLLIGCMLLGLAWAGSVTSGSSAPLSAKEFKAALESRRWATEGDPYAYYWSGYSGDADYQDPSFTAKFLPAFTPTWKARYEHQRQVVLEGRNVDDASYSGPKTADSGSGARRGTDYGSAKCEPLGMPFISWFLEHQFAFSPKRLLILNYGRETRTVWMDGRALPKEILAPQYDGYSVGRWEGSALVIETIGMRDGGLIEPGMSHSDVLRVVERYTPLSRDRLRLDMSFYDDKAFTKPWQPPPKYMHTVPLSIEEEWLSDLDTTCENNRSPEVNGTTTLLDSSGHEIGPSSDHQTPNATPK